jgi:hypothetical protein
MIAVLRGVVVLGAAALGNLHPEGSVRVPEALDDRVRDGAGGRSTEAYGKLARYLFGSLEHGDAR